MRDQIQQDNVNAGNGINKSVAIICNEEVISFEQVFYILFLMLSLFAINHVLVYTLISFQSKEFILTNLQLFELSVCSYKYAIFVRF